MTEQSNRLLGRTPSGHAAGSGVTWGQVKFLLRRYANVVLFCFLTTVLCAYGLLSFLTDLYETEATLMVKLGRENLDPPGVSHNVPLTAGLRMPDPLLAKVVVAKLIELYMDRRVAVRSTVGVSEFLDSATKKRMRELRTVEPATWPA